MWRRSGVIPSIHSFNIYLNSETLQINDVGGMATIGSIQEFQPEVETIDSYLERVEVFTLANGIKEEKRVAILLSEIGGKVYGLLRNLVAPATVSAQSYQELTATLKAHFDPKPIVIAEGFHFHRRVQAVGESISEYVAELKRLANNCQFGQYLDEALRDRLVCGMRSQSTQKRLLAEADLTFSKAQETTSS